MDTLILADTMLFLSTLSLRRATNGYDHTRGDDAICIHPLLAGSGVYFMLYDTSSLIFLSTLSLRRATGCLIMIGGFVADFYPRSPCGERLVREANQASQGV